MAGNTLPLVEWFEDFQRPDPCLSELSRPRFRYASVESGAADISNLSNGCLRVVGSGSSQEQDPGSDDYDPPRILSSQVTYPWAGTSMEFECRLRLTTGYYDWIKNNYYEQAYGTGVVGPPRQPFSLNFGLCSPSTSVQLASNPRARILGSHAGVFSGQLFVGFSFIESRTAVVFAHYRHPSIPSFGIRREVLRDVKYPYLDDLYFQDANTELLSDYMGWVTLGVVIDGTPAARNDYPTVEYFMDGKSLHKSLMPGLPRASSPFNAEKKAYLLLETTTAQVAEGAGVWAVTETIEVDYMRFRSTREASPEFTPTKGFRNPGALDKQRVYPPLYPPPSSGPPSLSI